ncbi:MAG: GNAT family N-acetyltransferase [Erysipelothrix sp.]|nr:GNAT family N-acetyltransferase [Erysipelothrix sp.]
MYVDGYMIEFDGQTIGYLLLSKTYSNEEGGYVTWVEEVYINDKYQGKGYGEITMKDIYQQFKDETKVFRLEVSPENKAIIDFYKRHGYEERVYLQMYHPNEEN